jgi:ABC-2 type transport system permease protein
MRDVVVLVVQGILLTAVALLFGLRASVVGVLIALVLVAIVALATSAASYAMALQLKSEDALAPLLNTIVLPLLLLSGILLPMTLAPAWLFGLSRINPFVYIVDAERAVFLGALTSGTVVVGIVVGLVLSALTVAWGVRTFHRESA